MANRIGTQMLFLEVEDPEKDNATSLCFVGGWAVGRAIAR